MEHLSRQLKNQEFEQILFCIGGDGSLRGTHAISNEIMKRN